MKAQRGAITDQLERTDHRTRKEYFAFIGVVLIGFLYVAIRAAMVPIVHDEAATFFHYVFTGIFLPPDALWDANNHVLNSVLTWFSFSAFGESLFSLRLPNFTAYLIWGYAVWWSAKACSDMVVRWCLILALLFCPLILDFFSLCRGYGIGMAFFLLALTAAFSFMRTTSRNDLVILLWSSAICVWADMALIPVLSIVIVICAIRLWRTKSFNIAWHWTTIATLLCTGSLGLLALDHVRKMATSGLLYHGSLDGFVPVTMEPLFQFVIGGKNAVAISLVLLFSLTIIVIAMVSKFRKDRSGCFHSPLFLMVFTLILLYVLTEFSALVLHINYPEDRAALQFVALFILANAFAVEVLASEHVKWRWIAMALFYLPLRTVVTANFDHTLLWSEQSLPNHFFDEAETDQRNANGQMTIGLYHQHALVWAFAQRQRRLPDARVENFPDTLVDVLLSDGRFLRKVSDGYVRVAEEDHDSLTYYERNTPLTYSPFFTQPIPSIVSSDEFIDLPKPVWDTMPHSPEKMQLKATIRLTGNAPCYWVVSTQNEKGDQQYTSRSLHYLPALKGVRIIDVVQVMDHDLPAANELKCYIWNPRKMPIELVEGTIEFSRITEH